MVRGMPQRRDRSSWESAFPEPSNSQEGLLDGLEVALYLGEAASALGGVRSDVERIVPIQWHRGGLRSRRVPSGRRWPPGALVRNLLAARGYGWPAACSLQRDVISIEIGGRPGPGETATSLAPAIHSDHPSDARPHSDGGRLT